MARNDTIEKAAQIWNLVHSTGKVLQTITDDDLRAIARNFGVTITRTFLIKIAAQ